MSGANSPDIIYGIIKKSRFYLTINFNNDTILSDFLAVSLDRAIRYDMGLLRYIAVQVER